ncbi:MAG: hypothetical protein ABEH59_13095 [Halobacteriales archaeon]
MTHDDDRVDPVELIDELAAGDQQALLEEVAERLGTRTRRTRRSS